MHMRTVVLRRVAGAFLAIVLVFGVIPTVILGVSLARAQHSLASLSTSLRDDDFDGARTHLTRALSASSTAESVTEAPLLGAMAGWIGLSDDLDALHTLASVLLDGARAASAVFEEVGIADGSGLAGALYRGGRIDVEAVHRLEGALSATGDVLARSSVTLKAAPEPTLSLVRDGVERATTKIVDARKTLGDAISVLEVLPGLVAEDGSRRYLLAFQSPSEARGGGGLIGVYGVLEATDGSLSLTHVGPIEELLPRLRGTVEGPGWFEDLYGGFRATKEFRMANLSPHFPTTAELWLKMYERATGIDLDGVIALDPLAVGELTLATGPLSAEGWDRKIDNENVRRVLLHDVYRHFDFKERIQNTYLRGLVDELWSRLESPDLRAAAMLRAVGTATRKQHMKIYSVDQAEQTVLSDLGVAGDYRRAGAAVQLLFNNNFAANKVDYFLHRDVKTEVTLREDGSADVEVEMTLANEAPTEPGSVLVRPLRDELPTGINDMTLYLLMPRGARATSLMVDGVDTNVLRGMEGAHPVAWQVLGIEPQDTATVRLSYRWPQAVEDGAFELTLWPQATARPDSYEVTVAAPMGTTLVDSRGERRSTVAVEGVLREPYELVLRLVSD